MWMKIAPMIIFADQLCTDLISQPNFDLAHDEFNAFMCRIYRRGVGRGGVKCL